MATFSETQLRSRLKKWRIRKDNRRQRQAGNPRGRDSVVSVEQPHDLYPPSTSDPTAIMAAASEASHGCPEARSHQHARESIHEMHQQKPLSSIHRPSSVTQLAPSHDQLSPTTRLMQRFTPYPHATGGPLQYNSDRYPQLMPSTQPYPVLPQTPPIACLEPQTHPPMQFPSPAIPFYYYNHHPVQHSPYTPHLQDDKASLPYHQQSIGTMSEGVREWMEPPTDSSAQHGIMFHNTPRHSATLSGPHHVLCSPGTLSPYTPVGDVGMITQNHESQTTPISVDTTTPNTECVPDISTFRRASAFAVDDSQSRQSRVPRLRAPKPGKAQSKSRSLQNVQNRLSDQQASTQAVVQQYDQYNYNPFSWEAIQSQPQSQPFVQYSYET